MGTYSGCFVGMTVWSELSFDEDHGKGNFTNHQFQVKSNKLRRKIEQLQLGDVIEVDVELNDYTVVDVRVPALDPRSLLSRIEALEAALRERGI